MKRLKFKEIAVIILMITTESSSAADLFGNPAEVGKLGQVELSLGGGSVSDLAIEGKQTTGVTQVGNVSTTYVIPASKRPYQEYQSIVFLGFAYTINPSSQVFANFGSGKNVGQESDSQTIGLRLAPQISNDSDIKMGLVIRAQKVNANISGKFDLRDPYVTASDGVNNYTMYSPINGTEKISYTKFDIFLGASRATGTYRPYGGLVVSRLSGTDSVSLNDTSITNASPVGGGAVTTSTQQVSFNANYEISASHYTTGVIGLSINPDGNYGITVETQFGLQSAVLMTGTIRF